MDIKSSVDFIHLNRRNKKIRISVSGWVFSNGGTDIRLYLNNELYIPVKINRFVRTDVCNQYDLAPNLANCGFYIESDTDKDLFSIELTAENESEKEIILSIGKLEIQSIIRDSDIVFEAESIETEKETAVIHGWGYSLDGEPVEIGIVDQQGNTCPVSVRSVTKRDYLEYGIIPQDSLFCGKMIFFPYKRDNHYRIRINAGEKTEYYELPASGYSGSQKRGFSERIRTVIRNIDRKNVNLFISYVKHYGLFKAAERALHYNDRSAMKYDLWLRNHRVNEEKLKEQGKTELSYSPLISLVVPVFNTPEQYLMEMIESVMNQSYGNWQLCIADGSDQEHPVKKLLQNYVQNDSRISLIELKENLGISENTNEALKLVQGEYTALLDHDDFLEPDALFEIVKTLQEKKYDILYTDEDKYNVSSGKYEEPNLKPDWSPDLFASYNYITHLFAVKTDIIRKAGGFRSEFDGAQDYELMFRCIEQSEAIKHVPKVLYHWRMHDSSTAEDPESKMYCYEAGEKAVYEHFERMGIKAKVEMMKAPYYGCYRTVYSTESNPLVSVIIPNYENKSVLETCIKSLFEVNTYKNFEIIVVENHSTSDEIFNYYKELQDKYSNVRVVVWDQPGFNFSALNNYGVQFANGELLLFLNNDTKMIKKDALSEMVGCCMKEETGAVGAKLLYKDRTVQHAGVILGFDGYAGHVFTSVPESDTGYMMRAALNCNYSAVTAACMMTKKELFNRVGGFDESLKVAGNDIDYCLKVRKEGKYVVFNAFSLWYHYESKTRGYENTFEKQKRLNDEIGLFQKKWHDVLQEGDPFYNSNFRIEYGAFVLK